MDASKNIGVQRKTVEQKKLMKRKNNIDSKVKEYYERMLSSVYGDPFPLYPSPTPIEAINATIVELSVPVESNKRKPVVDDSNQTKSQKTITISQLKRKNESNMEQPKISISFQHMSQLHNVTIDTKAGKVYRYFKWLLNKQHEEHMLLENIDYECDDEYTEALESYERFDIEDIIKYYNMLIHPPKKYKQHQEENNEADTDEYGGWYYDDVVVRYGSLAGWDPYGGGGFEAVIVDTTNEMIKKFEELEIDYK
jgi:hypothetical protein